MKTPEFAGPERLPPIPEDAMNEAQKAAVATLVSGPRGKLQGPFVPMLRSPGFMERAQKVGEFIRYESALPALLRELAILVTAAHWGQAVEWHIHAPLALQAGLSEQAASDIHNHATPKDLGEAERAVYDFCRQLHERKAVDDGVYARALATLGDEGLIDLTGLCGYYAMLAMVMNVARTPVRG